MRKEELPPKRHSSQNAVDSSQVSPAETKQEETFTCIDCGKIKPKKEMSKAYYLVCKKCAGG
ncbi:hypothetical protein [Candidatus Magnetobacterium casense]|uniref:DksA C4-type domain-containing protein n=1 Tax=Candidatus Magnetobacterium casense TaxID=1455061 RepID=A0ABS6RUQ0_9BACT|nr:hypothetical protein [Candidatus Magnetobacterium casensis]MBV6340352.1 hypothetical protein [Candidatus Magnetobacterium casensis]